MTVQEQVKNAVEAGRLVECSKDEYPVVRAALQDQAAWWREGGYHIRAQIADAEVRRLDGEFGL
jgi:hypothetical protein